MNLEVIKKLFVPALCMLAMSFAAVAQQKDATPPKDATAPKAAAPAKDATAPKAAAPVAGIVPLGVTIAETAVVATGWRASKLIHAKVYNDQNQSIGKIDDFIVSPDGKLTVAIIDVGGFLGMGAHRVAIPTSQFKEMDVKKVVLPGATKDALKALPEFRYTQ
jgi:hypothetical protein